MNLKEYFAGTGGTGILSTADSEGRVDSAIYSSPHVFDDGTVAFIMRERLTHRNLSANPFAAFLFIESAAGYRGVRLFLRKVKEEDDPALIAGLTRRHLTPEEDRAKGPKHLVCFEVEKLLPLIGSGDVDIGV